MSMTEEGIAFPSSLHGHYVQNRQKNETPLGTPGLRPAPFPFDNVVMMMMMEAAVAENVLQGPEGSVLGPTPPLGPAAGTAHVNSHVHSHVHSHVQTHAHHAHAQFSLHESNVSELQPHIPIPFSLYHHNNIIPNDLAASLPLFTGNPQPPPPPLFDTSASQPAYAGSVYPQNVFPWGDYTYSPDSQSLGHFNHPDPRSPEDWVISSPNTPFDLAHQRPFHMDVTAVATRPQPRRLWSGSTASHPSVTSPGQSTKSLGDYSDFEGDEAPGEHGSKRKRQLESNRKAARKCRQKIKDQEKDLEAREKEAQELNMQLHAQATALKDEVLLLKNEILSHSGCDCALIKQYITSTASEIFRKEN